MERLMDEYRLARERGEKEREREREREKGGLKISRLLGQQRKDGKIDG